MAQLWNVVIDLRASVSEKRGLELTLDQLSAALQDDYARTVLAIADDVASFNDGQQLKPTG